MPPAGTIIVPFVFLIRSTFHIHAPIPSTITIGKYFSSRRGSSFIVLFSSPSVAAPPCLMIVGKAFKILLLAL
jgi:hypothetical protein